MNTVLGEREGPVGQAWATALATPSAGHAPFVVVLQPGLPVVPFTLFVNKARIEGDDHGRLTWGAAQAGVASGVTDAVAAGTIDEEERRRAGADRGRVGQPRGPRRRPRVRQQPRGHRRGAGPRSGRASRRPPTCWTSATSLEPVLPQPRMRELDDGGDASRRRHPTAAGRLRRRRHPPRLGRGPRAVRARRRRPHRHPHPRSLRPRGPGCARRRSSTGAIAVVHVLRVHDPERHRRARRGRGHRADVHLRAPRSTATGPGARPTASTETATDAATARGGSPAGGTRRSPGERPVGTEAFPLPSRRLTRAGQLR